MQQQIQQKLNENNQLTEQYN